MITLFTDQNGKAYDAEDVRKVLYEIGAADCETLFIHSDVIFGMPGAGFKRKDYLSTLYDVINSLGVHNIIVPAYTYSFCNHEDFDIVNSKTSMGAFNEYIRKTEKRFRTADPLLSLSVPENLKGFFEMYTGEHSLGVKSGLDAIHHMDGVKFLFFGTEMAESFTYVHYVEKIMDVPYRFDMPFEGTIIFEDGSRKKRKQYMHTQCYGVELPQKYDYFETEMIEKGFVKKARLGDKYVSCFSEKDAYEQISIKIKDNINYFLKQPFHENDLIHKYTYDFTQGRITHC